MRNTGSVLLRALGRKRLMMLGSLWMLMAISCFGKIEYKHASWWNGVGASRVWILWTDDPDGVQYLSAWPPWPRVLILERPALSLVPILNRGPSAFYVDVPLLWPLLAITAWTLLSARREWLRPRRGLCRRCAFDLRGMTDRCPECGEPIGKTKRG